jgi:hypothetical protein
VEQTSGGAKKMVIDGTIRWNLNTRPSYQETAIHEQELVKYESLAEGGGA